MDTVLLIVIMGAALYFLMIRPQQKRAKEQKNLMEALAVGSRIMTVSGIIGTVKHLGENQAVIEISPGVEMTIDKRAISPNPVTDEFEYSDETGVAGQIVVADELSEEAAFQAPELPEPADPEPVDESPADGDTPTTWDNPPSAKN